MTIKTNVSHLKGKTNNKIVKYLCFTHFTREYEYKNLKLIGKFPVNLISLVLHSESLIW